MQAWQAESPHFSAVVLGQQPIIAFKHPSSADRQFARSEEFIKRMYLVMHGSASEKPTLIWQVHLDALLLIHNQ